MELVKMNFFKKFNDEMPIGLCSLGLKNLKKESKKNKEIKVSPNFFTFVKNMPL